jgi:hypothetical protein
MTPVLILTHLITRYLKTTFNADACPIGNCKASTKVSFPPFLASTGVCCVVLHAFAIYGFIDCALKGLSHEIDFKNFDKNLQNLT